VQHHKIEKQKLVLMALFFLSFLGANKAILGKEHSCYFGKDLTLPLTSFFPNNFFIFILLVLHQLQAPQE